MPTSDIKKGPLYVDSTNNRVGIGTSSPDTNLDVERSSNDTGGIKVQNTNNAQGSAVAQVEISGGDNAYANLLLECNATNHSIRQDGSGNLKITNGSTERLRIDSSGNVGIGQSNPTYLLKVGPINTTETIAVQSAGGGAQTIMQSVSGSDSRIGSSANTPLNLITNNVSRMTIDTSGRVTMPYQPAFHAYGTSGSWTTFSNGSWTTLVLPATALNTGNHYNTSSSTFTAPVAGVYHFYYKVYGRVQSGGGASTYWQSRFQKNNAGISGYGALIMAYQYTVGGTDEIATYSTTVSLAANDQITLHAQSAGSYNGEYYPPACEFGGHLIG